MEEEGRTDQGKEQEAETQEPDKQEGSVVGGLFALAGGLWLAWRIWEWRYPAEAVEAWKHAQGPYAGTGIIGPLIGPALWTLMAFLLGALVGHYLWRFLVFLGRAMAEGFRRGYRS
jgi:hypothetical protein